MRKPERSETRRASPEALRTTPGVGLGIADRVWTAKRGLPTTYEHVMCPSCAHIHFINKTTGKALGDKCK